MVKGRNRATDESDRDLSFGGWRDWLLLIAGGTIFLATLWAVVQLALANRGRGPIHVSPFEATMIVLAALIIAAAIGALKRWWSS